MQWHVCLIGWKSYEDITCCLLTLMCRPMVNKKANHFFAQEKVDFSEYALKKS